MLANWFRSNPFLLFVFPLVFFICFTYETNKPVDLLQDTQFDYVDSTLILQVRLLRNPLQKTRNWQCLAEIQHAYSLSSDTVLCPSAPIMLYLSTDSEQNLPQAGDILLIHSRITRPAPTYPSYFDYGLYMRKQHILGMVYADQCSWQKIGSQQVTGIRFWAYCWQQKIVQTYERLGLKDKELAVVSALTVGDREQLDNETQQSFSNAGAMHILAVSGLHTGIVYSIIFFIFTLGGLYKPLYNDMKQKIILFALCMSALWAYAFLTGLSPSVLRASLMLTIAQFATIFNRQGMSINTLMIAAFIILIINPLSLFSVSFLFSFGAVLGILTFGQLLNDMLPCPPKIQPIRDLFTISLAAQLGVLPIGLYYFAQTSNYFFLTNLVVIPMAYIILMLAILALAFSFSVVGVWIASVLSAVTKFLCTFVTWVESLKGSTTYLAISAEMMLLLYGAIFCAYFWLKRAKLGWLVPIAVCLGAFCWLNWQKEEQDIQKDRVIVAQNKVYYECGKDITTFGVDSFLFATHHDTSMVFVRYVPYKKRTVFQDFCEQNEIVVRNFQQ